MKRVSKNILSISETHLQSVEEKVAEFIDEFVTSLLSFKPKLAEMLNNILHGLYGFSIGDPREIKEVIFAQSGLALLLSSIFYESIKYIHNLKSLHLGLNAPLKTLREAINEILKKSYNPIFETTKQILDQLPSSASRKLLQDCLVILIISQMLHLSEK